MSQDSQSFIVEQLIADFLARNGYLKTLNVFQNESSVVAVQPHEKHSSFEPLEAIIHDRFKFTDFKNNIESFNNNSSEFMKLVRSWDFKQYDKINKYDLSTINSNHLTLGVSILHFKNEKFLLATANDKTLKIISLKHSKVICQLYCTAVMKSFNAIDGTNLLVSAGMDGNIYIYEFLEQSNTISHITNIKVHARLITKICILKKSSSDAVYIASIGIDKCVCVSIFDRSTREIKKIASTKLKSTPTDLVYYNYLPSGNSFVEIPILMVTKYESTSISVFKMQDSSLEECVKISLNDAEFSNHEFSATSIDIFNPNLHHPKTINQEDINSDPSNLPLITVGTSHTPYMRLITTQFPVKLQDYLFTQKNDYAPDILRGMIIANISTTVQQDKFSSTIIQWSKNGSGIWVFTDSGIIQAINFKNGSANVMIELSAKVGRFKCGLVDDDFIIGAGTEKKIVKFNVIK